MPDSTADRKSIRRLEKQVAVDLAQREAFVRTMMSTLPGRTWLWHHLSSCHCFSTTFTGDPLTSAFSEGQRSIGLALLAEVMSACPDLYIQAMRESHERNTLAEQRSSPQPNGRDPRRPSTGDGDSGDSSRHDDYDPYDPPGDESESDRAFGFGHN
jgi:hypothetical protein